MIIALVGASGTGKSSIERVLYEKYNFQKIISYTTREPRTGEENHKDYHFISKEEFQNMIDQGQLAEWDEYTGGRLYGTATNSYLTRAKDSKGIVCVLTPDGVRQLKAKGINPIVVYVKTPLSTKVKRYIDRVANFTISDLQELYARSERDSVMFKGMEREADLVLCNDERHEIEVLTAILLDLANKIANEHYQKTIYVDFDNTIVNTTKRIVELYNEDFRFYKNYIEIDYNKIQTYGFKECNCASEENINQYFNSPRFFEGLEYLPGAYEALTELSKKYKIVVVSMGYSPNLKGKEEWLKKELPFAEFIGCNLKQYKDKSHLNMTGGIQIDDTKRMLETTNAERKIWMDSTLNNMETAWNDLKENLL